MATGIVSAVKEKIPKPTMMPGSADGTPMPGGTPQMMEDKPTASATATTVPPPDQAMGVINSAKAGATPTAGTPPVPAIGSPPDTLTPPGPNITPPNGTGAPPPVAPTPGAPVDPNAPPNPYAIKPVTREVTSEELVSEQLNKLLSGNSPLIQRAKARAAEAANSRGLQNSTMAVQAGEAAAIDAMVPIATSDAGTYSRQGLLNQDVTNQFLGMEKNVEGQRLLAGEERVFQGSEAEKNRALQRQEIGARMELGTMQLQASAMDAQMRLRLGEMQIAAAREDSVQRERLAMAQIDNQFRIAGMDDNTRRQIAALNAESQMTMQLGTLSSQNLNSYANMVANIFAGQGEQGDKINNFRLISSLFSGAPNFPLRIDLSALPGFSAPSPGGGGSTIPNGSGNRENPGDGGPGDGGPGDGGDGAPGGGDGPGE